MSEERTMIVRPGDRIDTLAHRAYGDPNKYQLLLDANPHLDAWNPVAGTRITIPDARQTTNIRVVR
jgi:phage tail protein X